MARFVRASKFRHVFGTAAKEEFTFENLKVSPRWEGNKVTASSQYIAVCWEARNDGGGRFVILDRHKPGPLPPDYPLVCGHKAPVIDLDFNPFNPSVIASVAEDGSGYVWEIPEGGLVKNIEAGDALQTLKGHVRKVSTVKWHPCANNILVTSSSDSTVKVWDVTSGSIVTDVEHPDTISCVAWSYDGSRITTTCNDKKGRLIDPRSGKVEESFLAHEGRANTTRCLWMGDKNQLFTVGVSKSTEREFRLWDPRNLSQSLCVKFIDTAAPHLLMPFYDNDTNLLYLAGKNNATIDYYEMVEEPPFYHFLSRFKSNIPQYGLGVLPKVTINDVPEEYPGNLRGSYLVNEIMVMLKATKNSLQPISFKVPWKGEGSPPEGLYPDTPGEEPALSAAEWVSGKNANPKLVSVKSYFPGNAFVKGCED